MTREIMHLILKCSFHTKIINVCFGGTTKNLHFHCKLENSHVQENGKKIMKVLK